jgi:ankyrin repeat protein
MKKLVIVVALTSTLVACAGPAGGIDPGAPLEPQMETAIVAGDIEAVSALLDAGLPVDANLRVGIQPIHRAAATSQIDIIRLLVDCGADVNALGPQNETPIMFAAQEATGEAVQVLIDLGANPNASYAGEYGKKPLHFAAQFRNLDALIVLLDNGVDVDQREGTGSTALVYAAYRGEVEMVEELIARGADVNLEDVYGNSPLELAYDVFNTKIIEALTDAGAVA